jgi:diguanylate cyclase (GGDEF)-like protein/PAS domain S-box-containing protein
MSSSSHPPLRALLISLAALAIPVAGAFWVPEALEDYEALLWMLAVVPAFLLAYYKSWSGAAMALAGAMAVVSVTYAVTQAMGRPMPDLVLAIVIIVIALSLGIGALAERLHRGGPAESPVAGFTDPTTGLPNRAHAELHLEIEFSNAQRGRPLAVVVLGIDNLKAFNARHGDIAGDEVVRLVADVLKRITRRMNLCARYADDEFLCVLGGSDADGSIAFVNRFQQSLLELAGQRPLPAISGGVATVQPSMKTHQDLVAAARTALKRAKKDGRGRLRVHGRTNTLPLMTGEKPATPAAEETSEKAADPRSIMPEGRGRGRKALIVAEQPPVRALLARYLNDHGFNVAQVSNVVDGVQSLNVEYDLLFTDISLREGIGAELVRAAKLRWPSMQIMGLVQQAEGEMLIETLNSGVDRYLLTPLDLPRVRKHITELLARHDRLVASVLESRQLTMEFQARANEAVNALRQTEEEYRTIVRTVHEVIFRTDVHGVFTFLNDAWQEVTGHSAQTSVGQAAAEFVHEDDRAQFAEVMRAVTGGERDNVRGELRLKSARGELRWLELRARRLFDADSNLIGATGTLEDITAQKQAQDALRRSEAASRGLLAALPDAVLLLSRTGVVLGQEGAAAGWDRPQPVAGATLEHVFPGPAAAIIRELIERAFLTSEVQVHEYSVAADDRLTEFEVRLAATSEDAVVAIIRNITERRTLEEQLRQSQKLEAIGRLAGGLAHDFNNLLTVVQGNAHMLSDELNSNEAARDYLQQISVAAERGATLVRQLLAFGRRQVMLPTELNLNALVEDTRSMLVRLIGEHIMLEVDLDPELGMIKADAGQVEQVLVNLAVNARDVMREGGMLRIATRNSALVLHGSGETEPDDVVLLTISDNGPGMDAATLERVFEPFFTTKGLAQASGLGLATVYGIVRQSGGTITVLSEPGQGTSFEIALPRIDT